MVDKKAKVAVEHSGIYVFGSQSSGHASSLMSYEKQRIQYPKMMGRWGFSLGSLCCYGSVAAAEMTAWPERW